MTPIQATVPELTEALALADRGARGVHQTENEVAMSTLTDAIK